MAKVSLRRIAAIKLAQIINVSHVLRAHGEILDAPTWLKVFANILSSFPKPIKPPGLIMPTSFGLSKQGLWRAAKAAGVVATVEQIATQVAVTKAWRKKESLRLGRPHYIPMSPEAIGEYLGVTPEIRLEAKAWNIVPIRATKEHLMEQSKMRNRQREDARRRTKGILPKEQFLTQTKPWEKCDPPISRSTWERRRAAGLPPDPLARTVVGTLILPLAWAHKPRKPGVRKQRRNKLKLVASNLT